MKRKLASREFGSTKKWMNEWMNENNNINLINFRSLCRCLIQIRDKWAIVYHQKVHHNFHNFMCADENKTTKNFICILPLNRSEIISMNVCQHSRISFSFSFFCKDKRYFLFCFWLMLQLTLPIVIVQSIIRSH